MRLISYGPQTLSPLDVPSVFVLHLGGTGRIPTFDFQTARYVVSKNLGSEIRCVDPISFDMEYTRDLGYRHGAVSSRWRHGGYGVDSKRAVYAHFFKQMLDPSAAGRKYGWWDITAQSYQIARQYDSVVRRGLQGSGDTRPLRDSRGNVAGGVSGQISATRSNVMDTQS